MAANAHMDGVTVHDASNDCIVGHAGPCLGAEIAGEPGNGNCEPQKHGSESPDASHAQLALAARHGFSVVQPVRSHADEPIPIVHL